MSVVVGETNILPSRRRELEGMVGSLPLKKRRLLVPPTLPDRDDETGKDRSTGLGTLASALFGGDTSFQARKEDKTDDEKLAILALMSASQSQATERTGVLKTPPQARSLFGGDSESTVRSLNAQVPGFPALPSVPASPKRAHLPRLDSPLPGGCHGRTSRNNSFCRRQPYKGGIYCKLHYQQYVLRSPKTQESPGQEKTLVSTIASAPTLPNMQHQDKRFVQGANDGEVRCLATTTRGRECAYIAVNGTKYCYLHADYDTNPPPRRGGASLRKVETPNVAHHAPSSSDTKSAGSLDLLCQSVHGFGSGSTLRVPNASKLGIESSKADSASRFSSLPLLSMVSTDGWAGKRVILSSGPLINRCGRVEKWGNGWVSVRVPGVGIHNRRSFELFVHPDQTGSDADPIQDSYYFPSSSSTPKSNNGVAPVLWKDLASLRPVSSSSSSEADEQESAERVRSTSPTTASSTLSSARMSDEDGQATAVNLLSFATRTREESPKSFPPVSSTSAPRAASPTAGLSYSSLPIVTPRAEMGTFQILSGSAALR